MHFGIIAAGEGSRLANEGVAESKPMLCLCGTPMIGRLIDIYLKVGAKSVNVVINDFMPDVRAYLEALKNELPVPLRLKIKSTPSSMHTFNELTSLLPDRGRFIVTTVDTIFHEKEFAKYVDAFRKAPSDIDGIMAVTDYIEDEKPLYVDVDSELNITAFKDERYDGFKYVSGGIYGLDGKAADVLDLCLQRGISRMRNFQRELISSGMRLKAYPMGKIIDVDHMEDIRRAEEFLQCEI